MIKSSSRFEIIKDGDYYLFILEQYVDQVQIRCGMRGEKIWQNYQCNLLLIELS